VTGGAITLTTSSTMGLSSTGAMTLTSATSMSLSTAGALSLSGSSVALGTSLDLGSHELTGMISSMCTISGSTCTVNSQIGYIRTATTTFSAGSTYSYTVYNSYVDTGSIILMTTKTDCSNSGYDSRAMIHEATSTTNGRFVFSFEPTNQQCLSSYFEFNFMILN
jgi:hypothetical protein